MARQHVLMLIGALITVNVSFTGCNSKSAYSTTPELGMSYLHRKRIRHFTGMTVPYAEPMLTFGLSVS